MNLYYQKITDELINFIANCLVENKIVAICRGKSESGPRALGNRSLLASPINKEMKEIVNILKSREEFRPVSPICMLEHASKWFDLGTAKESPFMNFSVPCINPDLIPSAVHIDGSSRVQTITEDENEFVYKLIEKFYNLTEIPMLINTSFNLQGQPIIETPSEAITAFLETNIDYLILENYLITRK